RERDSSHTGQEYTGRPRERRGAAKEALAVAQLTIQKLLFGCSVLSEISRCILELGCITERCVDSTRRARATGQAGITAVTRAVQHTCPRYLYAGPTQIGETV
ncbi:unnamed protein product, partial [Scytosiphon promiscuus]